MGKEEELDDLLREETARGRRRPVRAAEIEKRRRLVETYRELLQEESESLVREKIRALGIPGGSPQELSILAAWRDCRRKRETSSR